MSYPAVVIVDYDPQWPARFEEERRRITAALRSQAVAVEHVGSTAVPGLGAKPIIDIMVGVRGLGSALEGCLGALQSIGYEYIPTQGILDRQFFQRGMWPMHTHHLHLVEFGGVTWQDYSRFRDHLRAHREVARQYLELKRRLAASPGIDRPAYTAAKGPFICDVLAGLIEARSAAGWSELDSTHC